MNQKEFMQLVQPFQNKLFRLAKRLLISQEEAEDATQEILVKLWNKKNGLATYTSIEALALTMTKNYCLDQLKSKRVTSSKALVSDYQETNSGLEMQLTAKNTMEWVAKIMASLPEQQRTILHLREVESYEFSEIAKVVEMNETAVRVALSRARKTVKLKMEEIQNYGIRN